MRELPGARLTDPLLDQLEVSLPGATVHAALFASLPLRLVVSRRLGYRDLLLSRQPAVEHGRDLRVHLDVPAT